MAKKTIAFSNSGRFWKTRYSFVSSCFGFLDKLFFSSAEKVTDGKVFWEHNKNDVPRNTFYGVQTPSALAVTFNQRPSSNKIFKSFSLEGTSNVSGITAVAVNNSSDLSQRKNATVSILEERGGITYGDVGSIQKVTGTNIKMIGRVSSVREVDNPFYSPSAPGAKLLRININNFMSNNPIPASGDAKLFLIKNSETEVFTRQGDAYTPALANQIASEEIDGEQVTVNAAFNLFSLNENFSSDIPFENYLTLGDLFFTEDFSFKTSNNIFVEFNDQNNTHAPSFGTPEEGAEDFIIHTPIPITPQSDDLSSEEFQQVVFDNTQFFIDDTYILCAITPASTSGDDPKGQYADAAVTLGSDRFELYALNMEYEPSQYDHSSSRAPGSASKSSKAAKRKR